MFRKLRQALEEALDRLEGSGGGVSDDDIVRVLRAMREELVDTKARIPELEGLIESLRRERERERGKVEECVRRASQAEEIGDTETLEVAVKFAERHKLRLEVVEQKIEATKADLAMHHADIARMTEELKRAMKRRDALEVQARRAGTIETLRGSGSDAVDEFERTVEKIDREAELSVAEEALDRDLDDRRSWTADPALERARREENAERMLRELKRRMGTET